jgi:iron complex outermembrane receptor protein
MRKHSLAAAVAGLVSAIFSSHAPQALAHNVKIASEEQAKDLGITIVSRTQPSSLPTQIPTTMEGINQGQIQRGINATDSEDALKYLPSLLVRKRYIGDHNHAILSTRASGTGNSARSMVFADGILLSNYLGNGVGGLSFPPRWGLVTPEEIERVDVMYGPFSAAYAGNSVGAVVDYVTRMPTKFESHFQVGFVEQPFELYNTRSTYRAWQTSASVGNKAGGWSWWLNFNHTDSDGQPLTFATRLLSAGKAGSTTASTTSVTGAVLDKNNTNAPWYVLGTGTQYHSAQDHLKVKLAYEINPTVRATYTLGIWQAQTDGRSESHLRDASGKVVYSGNVNINGLSYDTSNKLAVSSADFPFTQQSSTHYIHGLSVKSRTKGVWDWEVQASLYDYSQDTLRQSTLSEAKGNGTGWQTLAAKGIWRPDGLKGAHIVDFGVQRDAYQLRYDTRNLSSAAGSAWQTSPATSLASQVQGNTSLLGLWGQDAWALAPGLKTVLGLRAEQWQAHGGLTAFTASSRIAHPDRSETHLSPKAALSWQWRDDVVLKTSVGRAVRFPTVSELYGATSTTNSQYINDPDLKPERSWTGEVSAEKDIDNGVLRTTFFAENTRDSLYSQTVFDSSANKNISRVQNVGRINTRGLEVAYNGYHVGFKQLDLSSSLTYTDSSITANDGFVVTPGDTLGKRQPNIPRWRASALGTWRFNEHWSGALGARYSGPQYRTLNNADVNGDTYQGVSDYFTVDVRAVWKIDQHFTAAFGIDNLNNDKYWNFHPYPQRSYHASLRADF